MPAVYVPYGFYPRKAMGSRRYTGGVTHFPMTVAPSGTLYYGALVHLAPGAVHPVSATPIVTPGVTNMIGVLQGVRYEDPVRGPVWSPWFPSSSWNTAIKNAVALINDDPDLWYLVQSKVTLNLGDVGKNYTFEQLATGNTWGRSNTGILATSAAVTDGARIIRVLDPGAANPDCLVQFFGGAHQYGTGFVG